MIWIPGNVPSSKSSNIKTEHGIFKSKQVRQYLQGLGVKKYSTRHGVTGYKTRPNLFRDAITPYGGLYDYPVILGMHFVRSSRRRFDFNNASQIICDLLAAHGFVEDDDCDHLYPVPMWRNGGFYSLDKHAPGVWLAVLDRQVFKRAVTANPFLEAICEHKTKE